MNPKLKDISKITIENQNEQIVKIRLQILSNLRACARPCQNFTGKGKPHICLNEVFHKMT